MFKISSFILISILLSICSLWADEKNPFYGKWQPSFEATMEAAKKSPEYNPADAEKMKKFLKPMLTSMRMEISEDKLFMVVGNRSDSLSYELKTQDDKKMSIVLQEGKKPSCDVLMVAKDRIQLRIEGSNDMDFFVWEPAKSMETSDSTAAIVAAALEEKTKEPKSISKEAIERTIRNNLRQIASAADQFYLENGVVEVSYSDLEGEYFKKITPANGEDYSQLKLKTGEAFQVVDKDGKKYVQKH